MDHVEKWLVEKAHEWPVKSMQRFGVLMAATDWHEEGEAVLARQFPMLYEQEQDDES